MHHELHMLDIMALLGIAVVFAKVLGGLGERFKIPSVLAELCTGILIGNLGGVFEGLESTEVVKTLSEMGVLFLLFIVGLETDIGEIGKVGKDATFAAFAGVIAPFVLAFTIVPFAISDGSFNHTLFIAAALTATSVGITARVLKDTAKLKSVSGQIILGAAVIDDVIGIIVLTIVSALVTGGTFSGGQFGLLLLKIFVFGLGVFLFRKLVLGYGLIRIRPLEVSGTVAAFLFSLTMILAWTAEQAGLAGIIGAFALGIALDDVHFKGYRETKDLTLEQLMKPITDFLVPIFFIAMGMSVKLSAMANRDSIVLAIVLIVVALVGKLVCGLVLSKKSKERGADPLLVGFGMVPRGEVGLIFAAMGLKLQVLNQADYGAVVAMVTVTTLMAPFLISMRAAQLDRAAQKG